MLDIKLLGTGGMMPLLNRYLTSCLIKYNGIGILIDCGEATQLALRNAGESSKNIDVICLTHFHADHIGGLPGLLLLMGNQGKTSLLTIIGPKGTKHVVEHLRVIAPILPYDINYVELNDSYSNEYKLCDITRGNKFKELRIKAFKLNHKLLCYGYTVELDRLPKFDAERAKYYGIPNKLWGKLQHGESVTYENEVYTPDMVMGSPRKGLKVTYVTDTRPCETIIDRALGSDLLICEAMYGDDSKREDAIEKKHMLMSETVRLARLACVNELWLTHFSPSMMNPKEYLNEVRKTFSNTIIPKDGQHKELRFED